MHIYSFEKLDVWKLSKILAKEIYFVTNSFPKDEAFGLISQMRRSSISVCSNIAEGSGRTSLKDYSHFLQLAYGSLMELLNQLIIAQELGYLYETKYFEIRTLVEEVSNKLNSLRNSILSTSTIKHLNN
jgi:four helix bundle protein